MIESRRLNPSMVRVAFGGDGLADFAPTGFADAYVSLLFCLPGSPDVPFDDEAAKHLPREQRPVPRRFTVRRWDEERRELWIDFVVHGDVGIAGRWAATAQPGDRLQFRGPAGAYSPSPEADWHLLVGDESALPAIGAALERIPAGAPTIVVGLVDGPEHELDLGTDVHWVHRPAELVEAVAALEFPPGRVHGFVHGEAQETRAVRRHLLADRGIDPAGLSLSPYWRRSMSDEAWREVKRAFLAAQEQDV